MGQAKSALAAVFCLVSIAQSAMAKLTIDDFEVGPVACVDVGPLGLGLDDTDCESAPVSQSHVAGGVRLVSLEAAGGSYMTGTLVPLEGADDGLLLSGVGDHVGFPSGTAYLTYDGTEGDAAPSFSAGALDLDLSLFDSLVLEAPEDTSAFISVRLLLSDFLQTRSSGWASATAGSYFFPLSEFTAVDLAHIRQIQFVISPRTGESLHVLDISAVADPSPGSGLPAPAALSPASGSTVPSTVAPPFTWSAVSGATGYRIAVTEYPGELPDDPAATGCAGCAITATTTAPAYTPLSGLPAGRAYWWRVQALPAGRWSDSSLFTTAGSVALQITSPLPGSVIDAETAVVRGIVTPPPGIEVGVQVNGTLAFVGPGKFGATVRVDDTVKVLVATARDSAGSVIARHAIPVSVDVPEGEPIIRFSATPDMGTTPFRTYFDFKTDVPMEAVFLDGEGDGVVDNIYAGSFEDVNFAYNTPGLYEPTITAIGRDGTTYSATTHVLTFRKEQHDLLLKPKWDAVKSALRAGDVAGAVQHVLIRRRADYTASLNSLTIPLSNIDQELTSITFERQLIRNVDYQMQRVEDGTTYSYPVVFTLDEDGIWRLSAF